jgi:DNA modification methylase
MRQDLFDLSIGGAGKYSGHLLKKPEYQNLVTFEKTKETPIYNWFNYKEGYAPDLVWDLLDRLKVPAGATVLDPFCGTGTTLLAARERGYNAVGYDILPLGVFVSNTKLLRGYDMDLLHDDILCVTGKKFGRTSLKWPQLKFIDMKQVFSKYAGSDLLFFKEQIMEIEDEKNRNFLLLGLLSIVLAASNVKRDGGVLRVVNKEHRPPVRFLFKHKVKRMYKDLKKAAPYPPGCVAEAHVGDARNMQLEPESVDSCVTSPPYLNWVDYTKIYGPELALLLDPSDDIRGLSKKSLRSHVGAEERPSDVRSETVLAIMEKMKEASFAKTPQVVEGYFDDMYTVMEGVYSALKPGGTASFVVSNVCLPDMTVDVDVILAELGEKIGYSVEEILVAHARWCDVHGIRKERPVRESVVVLRK